MYLAKSFLYFFFFYYDVENSIEFTVLQNNFKHLVGVPDHIYMLARHIRNQWNSDNFIFFEIYFIALKLSRLTTLWGYFSKLVEVHESYCTLGFQPIVIFQFLDELRTYCFTFRSTNNDDVLFNTGNALINAWL